MEDTTKPRPAAKQPVKKAAKPVKRGRILRLKPGPLRNLVILVIVLIVVFGVGSVLSRIWTNYWWYAELAQTEVFWTPFVARLCVGLFFAAGVLRHLLWESLAGPEDLPPAAPGQERRRRRRAGVEDPPPLARTAPVARRHRRGHHRRRDLQRPLGGDPALPAPDLVRLRRPAVPQGRLVLHLHAAGMEDAGRFHRHRYAVDVPRHRSHVHGRQGDGAERAQPDQPGAARQGPSLGAAGRRDGGQGRRLHDPDLVARTTPAGAL